MSEATTPEALPEDVELRLSWRTDDGQLVGALMARNVGNRVVRLSGKPVLRPIGADGEVLDTETVVSLELRIPDYVDLAPGGRARAPIGWAGWDGAPASGRIIVEWPGGQVAVLAEGPRQPASTGPATNLWSSWFELES
jgi:hypothetical protein